MKRSTLYLCFAMTLSLLTVSAHAGDEEILWTIQRYTDALQTGEVDTLKELLGGRLYSKRRALLERNAEYPDWLRTYYAGATFSTSLSHKTNDRYPKGRLVNVETTLASGETVKTALILEPTANDKGWEIVDRVR